MIWFIKFHLKQPNPHNIFVFAFVLVLVHFILSSKLCKSAETEKCSCNVVDGLSIAKNIIMFNIWKFFLINCIAKLSRCVFPIVASDQWASVYGSIACTFDFNRVCIQVLAKIQSVERCMYQIIITFSNTFPKTQIPFEGAAISIAKQAVHFHTGCHKATEFS